MGLSKQFLLSSLTEVNPFISTNEVIQWLEERNEGTHVKVTKTSFSKMKSWYFDKNNGLLRHESGKFFTISGIHVKTNWGKVPEWEQPIIIQPEIGYLGIITKEFNGILYFLLQAKIEPGNVNNVQLSPTLQATKSNYTQVHAGKKPLYLEYFQHASKAQVLIDQLQSEQGARFLKKRNRNIIIKIKEEIELYDDFVWLTLGQIKELIKIDNLVNMDTRTVISGIPLGVKSEKELIDVSNHVDNKIDLSLLISASNPSLALHTFEEIIKWMTVLKCYYELEVEPISLLNLNNWIVGRNEIYHHSNKYFKVIATEVEIGNREVQNWFQPLIEPMQSGIIAYLCKKINGVYHFLVQGKLECGNFDVIEMAPTVQCITGSYKNVNDIPFLAYILSLNKSNIIHDSIQSEEGGRFYKEQNRNLIVEADNNFNERIPDNYIWMTLNQLNLFLKFNNYLNIQSRSLIATINYKSKIQS